MSVLKLDTLCQAANAVEVCASVAPLAVLSAAALAPRPLLAPVRVEAPPPASGGGGSGGAAVAAEVMMSAAEIARKLDDKAEKKRPPQSSPAAAAAPAVAAAAATAAVAPPAVADEKKQTANDDTDVVEIAAFSSRPFLESATFFGRKLDLKPEMQIRARDVPFIENYIRRMMTRAFVAWVVFRRMHEDREKSTPRSFSEFTGVLSKVISDEENPFVGAPGRLSFVVDNFEGIIVLLMDRAAADQKVRPPTEPTVPSITFMQHALLKEGLDTTIETPLADVDFDDIVDIHAPFKPRLKPMAIYTGIPGLNGLRKRRQADKDALFRQSLNNAFKRVEQESNENREAKRRRQS